MCWVFNGMVFRALTADDSMHLERGYWPVAVGEKRQAIPRASLDKVLRLQDQRWSGTCAGGLQVPDCEVAVGLEAVVSNRSQGVLVSHLGKICWTAVELQTATHQPPQPLGKVRIFLVHCNGLFMEDRSPTIFC